MAIVINGSGTVTGISVGGLPDGIVDGGTLAANAVDNAHVADNALESEHYAADSIDTEHLASNTVSLGKMAHGTDGNLITYDANGAPAFVATGSDGQVLTSTGAGSPPAFEAAAAGGATHADIWRMTTSFSTSAVNPIVNWASDDGVNVGHLGTQMTYSSGIFTFPTTGYWRVAITPHIYKSAADARQVEVGINTTHNNSSYTRVACIDMNLQQGGQASNTHSSGHCETILDITSTSNMKVKFDCSGTASVTHYGNTSRRYLATFTRLGDT